MTYSIKQLAKIVAISPHTIRYYEKIDLLPAAVRNNSSYRIYNDEDVERLKLIICLKNIGMSLADIKPYLNLKDYELLSDYPKLMEKALKHKEKMLNQIEELQKVVKIIDSKLEQDTFRNVR
ncbi:DNA-binding transcriptional regulator, MerR family [Amphibacillus marinus]|uniref:DNA-binding transcriptional regulator, MerR family n=1 Tax=Amphibacillus marinus TaxID=872970 RepID=A0A1H8JLU3_9BACI|nr:MerR family transcriptional regulator [Amphibacillus marinus]SEN81723.1 DNA-binding transcriptional regulator, MerR family [Amphibacillus marinus]